MSETLVANQLNGETRLNLGAGNTHLTGFVNLDRKDGQEIYPLAHSDDSIEEMVASHCLEHFSHRNVADILAHWVTKLKPGGKIRIAVPDFELVCKDYLAGKPVNVQGYVMGGQTDRNDFHGVAFDKESLTEVMVLCGLERIGPWKSDIPGCSNLPYSLNLQGFKPTGTEKELKNVRAVISVPRFGPLLRPRCAEKAFHQLRIKAKSGQSCYWHQQIAILMEEAISEPHCEFVLTMDYDTVFCAADILELYRLMRACPDVDAIFPMQAKRGCEAVLYSLVDTNGRIKTHVVEGDLYRNLLPANTGHFGLTMFRADSLRKFPRPWMVPQPNAEGRWDKGQVDADIDFWIKFKKAGFKYCLAPKIVVGHLEEVVKWPGKEVTDAIYQTTSDYDENGIPAEVVR